MRTYRYQHQEGHQITRICGMMELDRQQPATNLAPGDYTVTVTDDNGCTFTTPAVTITGMTLTATISSFTDPSCFGFSDGNVTVTAGGGTPDYSYSWTGKLNPTLPTASSCQLELTL